MAGGVKGSGRANGPALSTRSDFNRNRDRILEAAREQFALNVGGEVQLEDIAEMAGVSRATLFRHIGSKQALLEMIYQDRTERVLEVAERAMSAADPWQGIVELIRELSTLVNEDRGLWEFTSRVDFTTDPKWKLMVKSLDAVFARARESGDLGADVSAQDILPLLSFAANPTRRRTVRWGVYTEILLGGLRQPYHDG